MSKEKWNSISEHEFESLLRHSMSGSAPEDIVSDVTPWKKAMRRVLFGMALNAVTLNFFALNYVLPCIGLILSLLGFRTLRQENKWLKGCFAITVIRCIYSFSLIAINTTLLRESRLTAVASIFNLSLQFLLFFCFWQGLKGIQKKAGLPPRAKGAAALMIWFLFLCFLGLIQYSGVIIALAMIIGYVFIIRSLVRVSAELDEAGYAVLASPIKVTDRVVVIIISAFIVVGCTLGYLFGSSYKMSWSKVEQNEHQREEEVKEKLLALGFPEYVLDDLSAEEIASCDGALQVISDVTDHYVDEERKEGLLRITGVGVKLPSERDSFMIIQHFLWLDTPKFYGTECIQLWPAYRFGNGWGNAGEVTGRVLYDKDGVTFASPYHSLNEKTFTSESTLWGKETSTDIFATFSMENGGEGYRGYLVYPIEELRDGWIADCWINYTHQQYLLQYPALSAVEMRIKNSWSKAGVFRTVQDALQFYSDSDGIKVIS